MEEIRINELERLIKLERAARLMENEARTTEGINKEYKLLAAAALRTQLASAARQLEQTANEAAWETETRAAATAAERRAAR